MSEAEEDLAGAIDANRLPVDDELPEDGEAPTSVDAEMDALLHASFEAAATRFAPVGDRVMARIDGLPAPSSRRSGRARSLPLLGRHRRLVLLGYASAAALLLTAYAGYWSVLRVQNRAMALEARVGVKNLAIALRALKVGSSEAPTLDVALVRLGLRVDPYGNAFASDAGRVYSFGPNGRDDRGGQDDVVATW